MVTGVDVEGGAGGGVLMPPPPPPPAVLPIEGFPPPLGETLVHSPEGVIVTVLVDPPVGTERAIRESSLLQVVDTAGDISFVNFFLFPEISSTLPPAEISKTKVVEFIVSRSKLPPFLSVYSELSDGKIRVIL